MILSLPPADLDSVCFSFSRSTVLPPAAQLFKECWGLHCHFYQRFYILNRCSSVFDNLPCSGINSHISKIMSIQSLVCWNEIRDVFFWKSFENQAFWSKAQHILFEIYSPLIVMHFENRNWPNVGLKMAFSMVLCINLNPWYWVYHLIVYGEVTFCEFQGKQQAQVKTWGFMKETCFVFSNNFINMHNDR